MSDTQHKCQDWLSAIKCGETSTLQFKQTFAGQKALASELIAFANSKGGTLLVGIEDKTGEIVGLTYDEIQTISREVGNTANEQVRPTLYLQTEVLQLEGKNILAIHINEGLSKPYKDLNNNIWVKQGADKRRITENSEILRLFSASRIYNPDEAPVAGTSLADLEDRKIDHYLQKLYGKGRNDFDVPYSKLMSNLRIADKNGMLTLAGLLYFGSYPQQFKPAFNIKAVAFYGNEMGGTEYRDSKDMEGTIPELFEQAMRFLDMNLHHVQAGQSFNSLGQLEISKIALEEILQNALCHREYIKQAPIRLLIFDNRIEIISPGALPDGLTIEDIKLGNTAQRNTLIAIFCTRTMLYRGLGTGIIRAMKEEAHIEFINDEAGNQFTTIIRRYRTGKVESRIEGKGETDISRDSVTDKTDIRDALTDKNAEAADKSIRLTDMLTDMLTDIDRDKLEELSNYLLSYGRIDNAAATKFLQCSSSTTKRILRLLSQKELLIAQGNNKGRVYILDINKING